MSSSLIDDFFESIILELINLKKIKISSFGTFEIVHKNERIGRNPKTKENKIIKARKVVLFKPSKEFKEFVNQENNG